MRTPFKPADYNSVSPYFVVNGARQLIDLLTAVFNGKEKRRYNKPDGKIMHAEVQIDDSIIMIADATEQYPSNHFMMHVYVADADDTYNKAMQYGCEPVESPVQKEGDPDRRGMFKDFAGNFWAVATQL